MNSVIIKMILKRLYMQLISATPEVKSAINELRLEALIICNKYNLSKNISANIFYFNILNYDSYINLYTAFNDDEHDMIILIKQLKPKLINTLSIIIDNIN